MDPRCLPASSNWPAKWPGHVFGWLLQVCYDSEGQLIRGPTLCRNQKPKYGDSIDPPGGP